MVLNVDRSPYFVLRKRPVLRHLAALVLPRTRMQIVNALPETVLNHNLARGIPFKDGTVDAVYHSHVLEHLDRSVARAFLVEVRRVLRPGGIHRIVVPDLELQCRQYLDDISLCDQHRNRWPQHEQAIERLIGLLVTDEVPGGSDLPPFVRLLDRVVRGDARARGHTHRWMYDRVSLAQVLEEAGFVDVIRRDYETSAIPNWNTIGLDRNRDGSEFRPGSLYLEATRA